MYKFKGRSSMKQFMKKLPIKWGFKYWYRCDCETGYVYQLKMYQGKKEERESNFGSRSVPDLCQGLRHSFFHVCFKSFFNSPTLIQKLHNNGLYGLSTDRPYRINMRQMKKRQRNEASRLPMQILQPYSLYQMGEEKTIAG